MVADFVVFCSLVVCLSVFRNAGIWKIYSVIGLGGGLSSPSAFVVSYL